MITNDLQARIVPSISQNQPIAEDIAENSNGSQSSISEIREKKLELTDNNQLSDHLRESSQQLVINNQGHNQTIAVNSILRPQNNGPQQIIKATSDNICRQLNELDIQNEDAKPEPLPMDAVDNDDIFLAEAVIINRIDIEGAKNFSEALKNIITYLQDGDFSEPVNIFKLLNKLDYFINTEVNNFMKSQKLDEFGAEDFETFKQNLFTGFLQSLGAAERKKLLEFFAKPETIELRAQFNLLNRQLQEDPDLDTIIQGHAIKTNYNVLLGYYDSLYLALAKCMNENGEIPEQAMVDINDNYIPQEAEELSPEMANLENWLKRQGLDICNQKINTGYQLIKSLTNQTNNNNESGNLPVNTQNIIINFISDYYKEDDKFTKLCPFTQWTKMTLADYISLKVSKNAIYWNSQRVNDYSQIFNKDEYQAVINAFDQTAQNCQKMTTIVGKGQLNAADHAVLRQTMAALKEQANQKTLHLSQKTLEKLQNLPENAPVDELLQLAQGIDWQQALKSNQINSQLLQSVSRSFKVGRLVQDLKNGLQQQLGGAVIQETITQLYTLLGEAEYKKWIVFLAPDFSSKLSPADLAMFIQKQPTPELAWITKMELNGLDNKTQESIALQSVVGAMDDGLKLEIVHFRFSLGHFIKNLLKAIFTLGIANRYSQSEEDIIRKARAFAADNGCKLHNILDNRRINPELVRTLLTDQMLKDNPTLEDKKAKRYAQIIYDTLADEESLWKKSNGANATTFNLQYKDVPAVTDGESAIQHFLHIISLGNPDNNDVLAALDLLTKYIDGGDDAALGNLLNQALSAQNSNQKIRNNLATILQNQSSNKQLGTLLAVRTAWNQDNIPLRDSEKPIFGPRLIAKITTQGQILDKLLDKCKQTLNVQGGNNQPNEVDPAVATQIYKELRHREIETQVNTLLEKIFVARENPEQVVEWLVGQGLANGEAAGKNFAKLIEGIMARPDGDRIKALFNSPRAINYMTKITKYLNVLGDNGNAQNKNAALVLQSALQKIFCTLSIVGSDKPQTTGETFAAMIKFIQTGPYSQRKFLDLLFLLNKHFIDEVGYLHLHDGNSDVGAETRMELGNCYIRAILDSMSLEEKRQLAVCLNNPEFARLRGYMAWCKNPDNRLTEAYQINKPLLKNMSPNTYNNFIENTPYLFNMLEQSLDFDFNHQQGVEPLFVISDDIAENEPTDKFAFSYLDHVENCAQGVINRLISRFWPKITTMAVLDRQTINDIITLGSEISDTQDEFNKYKPHFKAYLVKTFGIIKLSAAEREQLHRAINNVIGDFNNKHAALDDDLLKLRQQMEQAENDAQRIKINNEISDIQNAIGNLAYRKLHFTIIEQVLE